MTLGLHVCCAPCLASSLAALRAAGAGLPAGILFYNPNIHPLIEFRRRSKGLQVYLERDPLPAEIHLEYGLESWLARMLPGGSLRQRRDRCYQCYLLRLGFAARRSRELGYDAFSTTLFASREQDHDLVAAAGREAAAAGDIEFRRFDFRCEPPAAALRNIYRQQYCGCVFSEAERFGPTRVHLYRENACNPPPQ